MLKNFLQHHKKLNDLNIGDRLVEGGEDESDRYMASNLLTVASTGNAALLDELLNAKLDPDIGDSNGRTPLHVAASKGYEECVLVLLKHGCNIHVRDVKGNTALWEAITSGNHATFRILYRFAAISDPHTAGDLLCTASRQNNVHVMKDLLQLGLDIYSKDQNGLTPLQVALAENHIDIVNLLVNVPNRRRLMVGGGEDSKNRVRVSIYRGDPLERRGKRLREAGKLILLPTSLDKLKEIAGEKFGYDASGTVVRAEAGAEVDSVEVIRDNDKIYFVEEFNQ